MPLPFFKSTSFKVTCDYVMLIFSVWRRNPIHTCLSILTYHHWNYMVCNSPSYYIFKSWLQVNKTCAHQRHYRCYLEELKQFKHKLPPRWVVKARGLELSSIIANFHLLSPLWRSPSNFVFLCICTILLQTILHTINKAWY